MRIQLNVPDSVKADQIRRQSTVGSKRPELSSIGAYHPAPSGLGSCWVWGSMGVMVWLYVRAHIKDPCIGYRQWGR